MVVSSSAVTFGQKELLRNWPDTEGLALGTTKIEGKTTNLVPEGKDGVITTIPSRNRALL